MAIVASFKNDGILFYPKETVNILGSAPVLNLFLAPEHLNGARSRVHLVRQMTKSSFLKKIDTFYQI